MIVFEDRVVQFPNRVKLSPVEGQPNVYDVSRQEGNVLKGGVRRSKRICSQREVA